MEQFLLSLFESGAGGGLAYAVVFGVLLLCGMGLPIPEDVSLILGGYLVFEKQAASAFAFGWLRVFTQSRKSRTWNVAG